MYLFGAEQQEGCYLCFALTLQEVFDSKGELPSDEVVNLR